MKYLIALFPLLMPFAHADECSSVWVFTAFKTCADPANGLDLTHPLSEEEPLSQTSDWKAGGKSQEQVCANVRDHYNEINLKNGKHAELAQPTPVHEKTENRVIQQEYKYECALTERQYPFKSQPSPVCGTEDKLSYQTGGAEPVGADVMCLSCDNFAKAKPAAMVDCLRYSIEKVVIPKAIELRDSDLQAISAQVSRMLKLSRQVPIANLQTTDQLSLFSDFLEKHPAQNEPNLGGGGHGNLPTLQ